MSRLLSGRAGDIAIATNCGEDDHTFFVGAAIAIGEADRCRARDVDESVPRRVGFTCKLLRSSLAAAHRDM